MFPTLKRLGAMSLLIATIAACDFEIINPGPVDDAFLDKVEAHQAIANGALRYVSGGLADLAYTTSAITRELFPAGSTSSFGISNFQQRGHLDYDDEHIGGPWTDWQRARYIGESGFARMGESHEGGTAGYEPAVDAALWAAEANRLLGENFCESAIDGSAIIPRTEQLERAEEWFTTTIEAAGSNAKLATQKTAAYAGRASVRVHLGDWAGALADAAQVPTSFVFYAPYEEEQQSFYNRTYYAGANEPYRAVTTWNTLYEDYYTTTQDPRTPWIDTGMLGDAAVQMVGNKRVPFYQQQKYDQRGSDIRLSSGYEMRLLEAEKMLMDNNYTGAMAILNARRTELSLAPLAPTNITEAWTMFKRERGTELWLEGRRLADLYRWKATNTPGELHELERAGSPASYLDADQDLCYPISEFERQSNPNIPDTPGG